MSQSIPIMPGDQFGGLTVVQELPFHTCPNGTRVRILLCRCQCGKEKPIRRPELTRTDRRKTVSCGCFRAARNRLNPPPDLTIHGFSSRSGNHYLYNTWKGIKQRCFNPGSDSFKDYGGRGITMFADWVNRPDTFVRWVLDNKGERPSPSHSIDRINNDGNYEPGNIRWATKRQQVRNTRHNVYLNISGVNRLAIDVADERGISRQAILTRTRKNMPLADVLATNLPKGPRR